MDIKTKQIQKNLQFICQKNIFCLLLYIFVQYMYQLCIVHHLIACFHIIAESLKSVFGAPSNSLASKTLLNAT